MPWHSHLKGISLHAPLQVDPELSDEGTRRAGECLRRPGAPQRQDPVACADVSRRLMELARRVAGSECTVLITGESGTGKEVLARYIHRHSARAAAAFVAVNCAAIPDNMLEALLFGWERGAFTGAHLAHAGKFEQAQSGTLLLDEITEIPLGLQAKLLRVLQEREVERLGARAAISLDVRVIATSNRRLREEVSAGRFREDLYYRLNVFPLAPAPLRQRREDVVPLAMRLLAQHSRPGGRIPALHPDAAQRLLTYLWPGNVRELDNVMQRALVLCDGELIRQPHIVFEPPCAELAEPGEDAGSDGSSAAGHGSSGASHPALSGLMSASAGALAESLAQAEQRLILQVLRAHPSRERAAAHLGISARTLRYKLARLRAAGVSLDEGDGS
jgi:two-component system response regulator FlrC